MTTRVLRGTGVLAALFIALAGAGGPAAARAPRQEAAQGRVKEFTVVAERFKFTPERIEVNEGDRVRLTVRSADGTHGFSIKRLKVDTRVPKGGEPVTIEFVADKAGEYTISCSEYCGRGHSHMKGVLEVLPAASGHGGAQ